MFLWLIKKAEYFQQFLVDGWKVNKINTFGCGFSAFFCQMSFFIALGNAFAGDGTLVLGQLGMTAFYGFFWYFNYNIVKAELDKRSKGGKDG